MKFKRLMALLLVCTMGVSLTACSGGNSAQSAEPANASAASQEAANDSSQADDGNDSSQADDGGRETAEDDLAEIIPEKTTELVVYSQLANYSGAQIGWFAEVLKEKFNVTLTIINEADGTFDTRMASGDLGDLVIFGNDGTQYISAVEAGMLYDWDDDYLLEDFGPYIQEHMPLALDKNRNLSGGKLYGYGFAVANDSEEHTAFSYHPDIRWDLYEKLGFPEVNTLEDFADVLEQMVALEPTSDTGGKTYGAALFPDWDGDMVMFVKATGALYGRDEFGFGLYDTQTQSFEDCLKDDGMYLRCLRFYNDLQRRGLLDPDSMTQTSDDVREDYLSGAAFFSIFDFIGSSVYNTPEHYAAGKAMLPLAAKDQKNIAYGLNVFGGNRIWSIGAKTDYPELCMAILNWLSTPEGTMTRLCGPQGVTWDYDDDHNPYLTDLGFDCLQDGETTISYGDSTGLYKDGDFKGNNETWATDAINPETNGETYNWRFWQSTQDSLAVPEITQKWRDHTGYLMADDYLEGEDHISLAVGSTYSMSTRDAELDAKWNMVATAIRAGSWKAIFAGSDEEFDEIVSNMREEADSYGYGECIDFLKKEAEIRKEKENEVLNLQ